MTNEVVTCVSVVQEDGNSGRFGRRARMSFFPFSEASTYPDQTTVVVTVKKMKIRPTAYTLGQVKLDPKMQFSSFQGPYSPTSARETINNEPSGPFYGCLT